MEKAQEVVADFKEDVEKLKEDVEEEPGAEAEADTDAESAEFGALQFGDDGFQTVMSAVGTVFTDPQLPQGKIKII